MFRLVLRSSDLSMTCLLANRIPTSLQAGVANCSGGNVGGLHKRSTLRKLVYLLGGTALVSGSVVSYALYDPSFRYTLENLHPHVPLLFHRIESLLPEDGDLSKMFGKAKESGRSHASLILPEKPLKNGECDMKMLRRNLSKVADEGSASSGVSASMSALSDKPAVAREETEGALRLDYERLENSVKEAISAKRQVIESSKKTSALLQEAIAGNKLTQENPDLASSSARLQSDVRIESEKEKLARKEMKKMRALLDDPLNTGLRSGVEAEARRRLISLTGDLEKTDDEMRKALSDNNALTQYKQIAQLGVRHFKDELKSVFRNIPSSEDGTPHEKELIALSALLSSRLELKEKELNEVAAVEMERAERMVDKQAAILLDMSEKRIAKVEAEIKETYRKELENQLDAARQRYEDDVKRQLKQQAAAHTEHLAESLKSQEERLEQLHKADVETRLYEQKEHLHERLAKVLAEVQQFAAAIAGREQREKENRRAKELWFTSRAFRSGVQNGRAGKDMNSRRKPLAKDIIHLRDTYGDDPFVTALIDSIPEEAIYHGVYAEVDLKSRFKKLDRICRKTVIMEEAGGGILGYWSSLLWSMFMFDPKERVTADEEIDLSDTTDKLKILSKAKYCVAHDDLLTAVKLMNLLRGEPARLASSWITDTIYFLETFQAAQLLVAHADATFKRTLY